MRVGIVGYGNMGSAFASALKEKTQVVVYDVDPAKIDRARQDHVATTESLEFLVWNSDAVLVAVKPKDVPSLLEDLKGLLEERLLVSIVAGLSIEKIQQTLGEKKVIRVMPNVNVLVRRGVMAFWASPQVSSEEKKAFVELFSSCGKLYEIKEDMMDSFTALAGSGPAFVFKFLHAMALSGVMEGFPYSTALSIVLDTVVGSCELLKEMGGVPEEWVLRVASPGGTTVEGIKVLEERGFVGTVMECVRQTSQKAKRLT